MKRRNPDFIPVFTNLTEKAKPLSVGGGSYLGVPCRGALYGRVEWEGEKIFLDPHPKDP